MNKAFCICTAIGLYFSLLSSTHATPISSDVSDYAVIKGQAYLQTGAAASVLASNSLPFTGRILVNATSPGAVTAVTVQSPANKTRTLTNLVDSFEYSQDYATKAALDATLVTGAYTFNITTMNDGVRTPKVTLSADAYPASAPHVSNWNETQNADVNLPLIIAWDSFTGGTTNDYISVKIVDGDENGIFRTPSILVPGALTGTNLHVEVPAGTLAASQTYNVRIQFFKRSGLFTTNYPGADGIAGFYKQTSFTLTTLAAAPAGGRIQFSPGVYAVSEGIDAVMLTMVRSDTNGVVTVDVATSDITATAESDYAPYSATLNFDDGVASANVFIGIVDDNILEGPETFKVSLSNPTGGAVLGVVSNAIVTILDNEIASAGVLQFSPKAMTITEAGPAVVLNVARTGGTTGAVSVNYATQDGSAVHGDDYTLTNGILHFADKQASKTISVRILQDNIVDTNETFYVTLSSPTDGAALGSNSMATVTIKDDDLGGAIAFSSATYSTNENAPFANITLTRTGGKADVDVTLYTGDVIVAGVGSGVATPNVDYVATNVVLHFASNELSKTFALQLIDDTLPEGDETVALHLTSPRGGATLGKITNATLTILENDASVFFTNATYTVSEAGPSIKINVVRSGGLSSSVSVGYQTVDGTAISTNDYKGTNGTLTFAPKVTVQTITIPIVNDTIVEGNETFSVKLVNPQNGAQLAGLSSTIVTITDNDAGGTIVFGTTNVSVAETAGKAAVTVKRTGGIASGVTVDVVVIGGSATTGADYGAFTNTVAFAAGEASKIINIPVINDAIHEGNETILLGLTNVHGGATIGSPSAATVTITDNDVAGTVQFSAANYSTNENAGNALITVTRSGGQAAGVTVDYTTANDIATAGADYTYSHGTLTFGSNELSKTFTVPINNDTNAEGNETLKLLLSNPAGGAALGAISNAILTIVDDESSVSISNATATVTEGSNVVITVVRSGALTTQVSVDVSAVSGTAILGTDFTATNLTLTFPPNTSSKTFTVHAVTDALNDGGETFTVRLSNPLGGVQLGARTTVTVTVNNAPDKNAIPLNGPLFIKGTLAGVAFNALAQTCFASDVAVSPFLIAPSWTTGSGTGTVVHQMTITISPRVLGQVSLNNSGNNGLVTYLVSPLSGIGQTYAVGGGDNSIGSSGTFILDAIDYTQKLASGRFTFHMREITDGSTHGFIDVSGSFRVKLQ